MSCPFCKKNAPLKISEARDVGVINVSIGDSSLKIAVRTSIGNNFYVDGYAYETIPIVFCPICGDNLDL